MTIYPPVRPYRGVRNHDSWGAGNFGASRDGGSRKHDGLDFLTVPGDEIVAVIPGRVVRTGWAYPDGKMNSIHLHGTGEFDGWQVQYLYVNPDAALVGPPFQPGDRIGIAQDVAGYWTAKSPGHAEPMKNHCHLRITIVESRLVDPAHYLPSGLTVPKDLTT